MVTRMGFEPMNATLRGWCVNHFTNRPCVLAGFLLPKKYSSHIKDSTTIKKRTQELDFQNLTPEFFIFLLNS